VHSFIVGERLNKVEVWVVEVPEPHLCSAGRQRPSHRSAWPRSLPTEWYMHLHISRGRSGSDITVGRIVRDAHDIW